MATSNEIAKPLNAPAVFDDDLLSRISSFEDAVSFMQSENVVPESITDYGTGFSLISTDEKSSLVGVPFLILDWRFNLSDKVKRNGVPVEFVSAAVVTKNGQKLIFNDGSTGIYAQLRRITDSRNERNHPTPQSGLMCEKGLTMSEYDIEDEKGNVSEARTFYLAE